LTHHGLEVPVPSLWYIEGYLSIDRVETLIHSFH